MGKARVRGCMGEGMPFEQLVRTTIRKAMGTKMSVRSHRRPPGVAFPLKTSLICDWTPTRMPGAVGGAGGEGEGVELGGSCGEV